MKFKNIFIVFSFFSLTQPSLAMTESEEDVASLRIPRVQKIREGFYTGGILRLATS